jgi:CubicO group peptidase (beta-lactamase class C family)
MVNEIQVEVSLSAGQYRFSSEVETDRKGASGHFLLIDPARELFVAGTTNQLGKPLLTYRTVRKIAKILA